MYQALYRKWRPHTFDEVVGQPQVTKTLKKQIETGRLSHAYLFIGARGTGKTSCAKILAKAVNCENPAGGSPCNICPSCVGIDSGAILDVEELDAASNNGVDNVRALRDEAVFTPAAVKMRVYIIDEVHMLSTAAFNALLKILEEPPAHLMFILATTEAHKIPATILSRCQQYSFKRVSPENIAARLKRVAESEELDLTDDAALLIAKMADGGVRDALSLLDKCAYGETVDTALVLSVAGLAGNLKIAELLSLVLCGAAGQALDILNDLYLNGKDISSLLAEISTLIRDILITKIAPKNGASLLSGSFDRSTLEGFSKTSPERLLSALSLISATLTDMPRSANRKLSAELCIIRLSDERLSTDTAALLSRISGLEAQLSSGSVPNPVPAPAPEPEDIPLSPAEPEKPQSPEIPPKGKPEPAPENPVNDDIWPDILDIIKDKIDIGIYTLISDPSQVTAQLDGNILTLYIENEFAKGMVESPEIIAGIKSAAQRSLGHSVIVKTLTGVKKNTVNTDKLDALSRFENTTFK